MLALIVPSVLLTTLAFQALDAEARARQSDRALGLQRRAEGIVRELDGVLREPARRLRQQIEERSRNAPQAELADALSDRAEHDPQLTGFVLFDAQGARGVPAPRATPTLPAQLPAPGGLLGAVTTQLPDRLVEAARQLGPDRREEALELLRLAARNAQRPSVQAGALLELGRRYLALPEPSPSDQLNAVEAFGRLAELPVELRDAWGRYAGAWGRVELVGLSDRMGNRAFASRTLDELLDTLERSANQLAPDAVGELAQRMAAYADAAELPAAAARSRA
ncbi:MAG: hypothetical protein KDD82_31235, partial [Planctomycetes bacterium]|nr:hypothetical protein [Planctomycetota bacterium]